MKRVCLSCGGAFEFRDIKRGRCLACHRANEKRRDASRPTPAQRGYTNSWAALSKRVRAEEPTCHWCHDWPSEVADHVVPLSKGGTSARENLVGACYSCNRRRASGALLPGERRFY